MKITFVLELYEPHIGGVETLFKKIAEGLVKLGCKCTVVTLKLGGTKSEEVINGVKIYRVKVPPVYARYGFSFFSIPKVFELVKDCDIVHTTTYTASLPAFLAAKLLGKPCVITVHEFFGNRWKILLGVSSPFAKGLQLLEKIIISLTFNKFIAVSNSTKKYLEDNNVKNIKVIYEGVDYKLFNPKKVNGKKIRKLLGLKDEFVFLYLGRPGISKGPEYFVKAIPEISKKIPKSKFLFILAHDPLFRYKFILNLIKEQKLGDKVIIHDPVPRENLPDYMDVADCIVIPSLSEGFGLNVAEACAMNKLVVTSNIDSIPEVVSGKYILINPKDPDAIVDACIKAYKGQYQKSKKKIFRWETCVNEHLKLYKEIIKSRS